jgi:hypothetical protein
MNKIHKKKGIRILIGTLVFSLLMGAVMTPSLHARRAICERALAACAIDATIAGLTGGPLAFALWSSGCLMGYDFCMRYYEG